MGMNILLYIVMWFGLIAMLMVLVANVVWWRRP
jgi:cytochrome oxidase assembly protein ShyY1